MSPNKANWTPTLDPADLDHILSHTTTLWDELRGQRLFITGGTGFFGHWLLESLLWVNDRLDLDMQITLLSRNPGVFADTYPQLANHPAISWIQGDVKTFDFPDGSFPFIIHAASEGEIKLVTDDPLAIFTTIVEGTRRVLDFAKTHQTRKFLFTSSGAVYGKQPPELTHIPENYLSAPDVMHPLSAYGEGKRAAEMLCTLYSHKFGFETKIARCFAFVGPYLPLDANFAIGNFIRDALNGGPIVIKGDGSPYRSYLYAADLAIWLWTILFKGQDCQPYNVGSDSAINIIELARLVRDTLGLDIEIKQLHMADSTRPANRYIPSINLAQHDLALSCWKGLPDSILKMDRWMSGIKIIVSE